MNLPNSITMGRIFSVPLLIWMLSPHFPLRGPNGEQDLFYFDFLHSCFNFRWRRWLPGASAGADHDDGMLLDPLADKLLITAAFICLVQYCPDIVKPWIAVLVIGREFLVTGLSQHCQY